MTRQPASVHRTQHRIVSLCWLSALLASVTLFIPFAVFAEYEDLFDQPYIDDTPRIRNVEYPEWFKLSFLDLREDLKEAAARDKFGIVVYFGQKHCAYCEALMKINFRQEDIVHYTQTHFDVIPTDIWGSREVTDLKGTTWTEREYAVAQNTNFTPSLVFYDREGKEAFRMRGYYPPYKFRAALEYVVEGYYQRESFRDYLARADPPPKFEVGALSDEDFFQKPPYALDRSRFQASRPLAVFFEQHECHACDILHTEPLSDPETRAMLGDFEVVQLDMWSDTKVVTPQGKRTTAREWAGDLGIFYAPTIVFFDERGQEIIRVDAVVRLYRLQGVVEYVHAKGYLEAPTYQRWRQLQREPHIPPPDL